MGLWRVRLRGRGNPAILSVVPPWPPLADATGASKGWQTSPPCGDESRRHTAHRTPTAQTPPFCFALLLVPPLLPAGCCTCLFVVVSVADAASWGWPGDCAAGVSSHHVAWCAESSPLVALAFPARHERPAAGAVGGAAAGDRGEPPLCSLCRAPAVSSAGFRVARQRGAHLAPLWRRVAPAPPHTAHRQPDPSTPLHLRFRPLPYRRLLRPVSCLSPLFTSLCTSQSACPPHPLQNRASPRMPHALQAH